MCGIFFSAARGSPILPTQLTKEELHARGPDSYGELNVRLPSTSGDLNLTFISSVLALRGDFVQQQPLQDPSSGSILCWNGEAWKVDGSRIEGNDSARIFSLLLHASLFPANDHPRHSIARVLSTIAGPFAFVFYDAPNSVVYYGRDRQGRRSLLLDHAERDSFTLCSAVASSSDVPVNEVPTTNIHFATLEHGQITRGELPWLGTSPPINKECLSHVIDTIPLPSSVDDFILMLKSALALRVTDIPTHCLTQKRPGWTKVAVLFSGGLDCTLLARLVHDILPKDEAVDLLNVAFENPRSKAALANASESFYELCPDRATGRSSFAELRRSCPDRNWRFVAINVPYVESQAHKPIIQRLMYPHNTEMDLSIAMALYFAARGIGELCESTQLTSPGSLAYTSSARVLLSGLGADELYGGYSRHAVAFSRGGFAGLADELELDFTRIGSRNLGRDDRVMSHWAKEVRFPFLDEDLVKFSLDLPVWEKCGFRIGKKIPKHYEENSRVEMPEDLEPAKLLLRLAMWKLGMRNAASERKRAIQFGARTAKMDIGKGRTKGTDVLVAAS